ncbi:MAG TPA: NAD(P)/FAD-dependent oxidoreductase [Solirubrobacteraceae bacterium]|nr:NAD(P)/FAD-dependent oxidoreductase [Solirubrobacteraceae bacterium]
MSTPANAREPVNDGVGEDETVHAPGRRRVVIVGGGFGGLTAARELRGADVDVTVVDRMHHHLFQPLLYQLACGGLGDGEIAVPIRAALRRQANVDVLMAEATGLDAARRRLTLDGGQDLAYDSLIVACGARTSYFGNEQWSEVTNGVKTLAEALALRNQLYGAFERAERAQDEDERRALMTFVVIGGGPTGVEVAGEIAIVCKDTLGRQYTRIGSDDARVILLDAGERVVPAFSQRLSRKAAAELTSLGVSVRESTRATAIDEYGVTVQAGDAGAGDAGSADAGAADAREERIAARTVIWAAGVRAAPFAATLAQAAGAPTDRAGRVQIEPDLTVPGHREISLIGDASALSEADGKPLPGLATVAIQQARHVARAIRAGQPSASTPFRYFDKGALAVVGRGRAVCAIRGFELWGRPAFFTYLTVHMYYLGGVPGQRLKVLIDWFTARLGRLQSQVIEDALQR